VAERPSADISFGTLPHSQNNGNVRYSIFGTPASVHQLRNRRYKNVGGELVFGSILSTGQRQNKISTC
jgi:hypothetical protein